MRLGEPITCASGAVNMYDCGRHVRRISRTGEQGRAIPGFGGRGPGARVEYGHGLVLKRMLMAKLKKPESNRRTGHPQTDNQPASNPWPCRFDSVIQRRDRSHTTFTAHCITTKVVL